MEHGLARLHSESIGLALSGGSVRGLAHIGVLKALEDLEIRPAFIAGTSAGSLVGAMAAAGLDWGRIAELARGVFWPSLLHGPALERFCERNLPSTFAELELPFAAVATDLATKQPVVLTSGGLARAISASCALRVVRRSVAHSGLRLKDGGIACVLPAAACRSLGAEVVIASDVWEYGSLLRSFGFHVAHPRRATLYPSHYRVAVDQSDILIQPAIPVSGYVPGERAVERLIEEGERAALRALTGSHAPRR
jgi:NTE family protein